MKPIKYMKEIYFKRSAIHNLVVTNCRTNFTGKEISEGLVVPKNILLKSDIVPWEQVIVTKIDGNNWINRIKTFVIEGEDNGVVEARGSLASFLKAGDLTCLITRTVLNEIEIKSYVENNIPIFDLGFDPSQNKNNKIKSRLDVQYNTCKNIDIENIGNFMGTRKSLKRLS